MSKFRKKLDAAAVKVGFLPEGLKVELTVTGGLFHAVAMGNGHVVSVDAHGVIDAAKRVLAAWHKANGTALKRLVNAQLSIEEQVVEPAAKTPLGKFVRAARAAGSIVHP